MKRLLIIDDNTDNVEMIQMFLETYSELASDKAHTGACALSYLDTISYDAILLDLVLPDMRGTTIIEKARAKGIALPPVIILSGNAGIRLRQAHEQISAYASFPKPAQMDTVLSKILEAMN